MTQTPDQKFRELWDSGVKLEAICAEFHCSPSTARLWRIRLGLAKRHDRDCQPVDRCYLRRLSGQKADQAISMYRVGKMDTHKISVALNERESVVFNTVFARGAEA